VVDAMPLLNAFEKRIGISSVWNKSPQIAENAVRWQSAKIGGADLTPANQKKVCFPSPLRGEGSKAKHGSFELAT
jgi:hypothetical protein